ncbi:DUF1653 domain-containing protein [Anaerocolumna sp. MB42-C2]|uniref:DUF1653 domain-containing protein n=1 Tax=Anaerocolumna sp. MB42-C2 TaxID=3070997 RepID=UPI0027DF6ABC|nr:DUF1653 domain-containing protein [Anaerocolumna sp. MB42-C2]WMJ88085.1 DUF1653 domain-containing protein [Anaerocolumna sp. MB42-C2]
MEQERIPKPGQIYRHFKNNFYQIITVATHTETEEKMVVYQALYGNYKTYARPLSMFMSEVDMVKYPNIKQKYRFEQVIIKEEDVKESLDNFALTANEEVKKNTASDLKVSEQGINEVHEEGSINPVLLEFLEADSYEEKLAILTHKKKYITDKILNDMAVSIDCTLDEGAIEERIAEFAYCLQTHARFENRRLR